MSLQVRYCEQSDFPDAAEVEHRAFADNIFTPLLFPGPFPDGALEDRAQEIAKDHKEDPTSRWLKVVESDLEGSEADRGIAFAKWNLYTEGYPEPRPTREFGTGCNVEACKLVFGELAAQRARVLGKRKCIYLHILVTNPQHGRRGAAGKLLAWGVEQAKQNNLPLYVESTTTGHELYKRYGFRDVQENEVDLSQWGASEPHRTWAMSREIE